MITKTSIAHSTKFIFTNDKNKSISLAIYEEEWTKKCYVDTLHACTGFEPNRFDINLSTIINLNQQIFTVKHVSHAFYLQKKHLKTLRLTQIILRFTTTCIPCTHKHIEARKVGKKSFSICKGEMVTNTTMACECEYAHQLNWEKQISTNRKKTSSIEKLLFPVGEIGFSFKLRVSVTQCFEKHIVCKYLFGFFFSLLLLFSQISYLCMFHANFADDKNSMVGYIFAVNITSFLPYKCTHTTYSHLVSTHNTQLINWILELF